MSNIFKASEWQDYNGYWHVADVSDLAHNSAGWWVPARLLEMPLDTFIMMLKDEYHAELQYFHSNPDNPIVLYRWKNYADAHKYLLYINRVARNKKWSIS